MRSRCLMPKTCREDGIRTHETLSRLHTFQACSFNHSDTSLYKWSANIQNWHEHTLNNFRRGRPTCLPVPSNHKCYPYYTEGANTWVRPCPFITNVILIAPRGRTRGSASAFYRKCYPYCTEGANTWVRPYDAIRADT
jgi:hypothetical protein